MVGIVFNIIQSQEYLLHKWKRREKNYITRSTSSCLSARKFQAFELCQNGLHTQVNNVDYGCIIWYLLFSVDNSCIRKPVDFAGKLFHSQKNGPTVFERFHRPNLQLKTRFSSQVVTKKIHRNENPYKVYKFFQLTKTEGLESLINLSFLEDGTNRTGS